MKSLIIAEKPSVASDLAKALGKFKKEADFFENENYIISSAVGHLVEIGAPENEEPKKGKWDLKNLPIIPTYFQLKPIERNEARFKVLKKLIGRKDVGNLVNACDAGREGELIFRYIIQLVGSTKPISRLWLQSMTPAAIRENFSKLRTDEEMRPLADAAMCRSEADWLVGINGTRALTSFNSKGGGFQKTTVGRVQTPTLAILVEREHKIRAFEPRNYWEVYGTFQAKAGDYVGRWFDEKFKRADSSDVEGKIASDQRAERIWEKAAADAVRETCLGKPGEVTEESKPSTQLSPLLYDLTSLQREANSRYGFPARMTLSLAQALYERHKAATYPRTDSRYLPDDYVPTAKGVLGALAEGLANATGANAGQFAAQALKSGWVHSNKRIFNQAKVSDHFAIIPTTQLPANLSEPEAKLYDMIVRRFIAVFFPAAVYEITTRITRVEEHPFKTEGKILKEAGWLSVYGRDTAATDDTGDLPALVPVEQGEKVTTSDVDVKDCVTKPPPRYSEATLLSAMEGAGKLIDDEELRDAMSAKGLGTPATRAATIEGLIFEQYVAREGRELRPTPKAFHLMNTLQAMKIPELTLPELTGEWEHKLKLIEQQKFTRPEFMREIEAMTRDTVEKIRALDPEADSGRPVDLIDPFSQQQMIETLRDYRTADGTLQIRKAIAGRVMDVAELRELLEKRAIGPLDGFRNRMGRPFSARIVLSDEKKVELDWGQGENGAGAAIPIVNSEPLGKCPLCGGIMLEASSSFLCDKAAAEERTCAFRVGKKILNQDLNRDQILKLLSAGKTDVLTGFVSQRTKRAFKAMLVLKEGKVSFEFPPREAKGSDAKKSFGRRPRPASRPET